MDTMETSEKEKPVTWSMVTETVKFSKLQLRNIVKSGGFDMPAEGDAVMPELLVRVLTAAMLENLVFLTPEQRALILDETATVQTQAVTDMALVAFADGAHCTWTGHTGFLDLSSGETVAQLPAVPMETISYNLNELYRRGKYKLEKRSGLHAKRQAADGDVEKPAHVRDSSTDSVSG
jgi:hypothetical protein